MDGTRAPALRAVCVLLLSASLLASVRAADPPASDARIRALAGADDGARREASRQLIETGVGAVPALIEALDRAAPGQALVLQQTLLGLVSRQMTGSQRKEVSARLIAELGRGRSPAVRREICRLLGLVGDSECVDPLYRLLMDADLRETARQSLMRIGSRSATQALVAGLQIVEPDFRVSLIEAIGHRRDAAAVPILRSIVAGPSERMSRAAIDALAHLPEAGALEALTEAVEARRPGAVRALLVLGETLADAGRLPEARKAWAAAGKQSSLSVAEHCRLLHGLARSGEPEDLAVLMASVEDPSRWGKQAGRVRAAALEGLATVPGTRATDLIAAAAPRATGSLKAAMVGVLERRGASMTGAGADVLLKASGDDDPAVRAAAVRAIEEAGVDKGVAQAVAALGDPTGPVREAAEHAVYHMAGPAMTAQILRELERPGLVAERRAGLVRAIGHRGGEGVPDGLLRASNDAEAKVREAAFEAMGGLGHDKVLDRLLTALGHETGPARDAAERALARLPGESVTARMRAACETSSGAGKASLLRVLSQRKAPGLAALLVEEAGRDDVEIRAAAAAGLSRLADPQHAEVLTEMARRGPAQVTAAAVAGLVAIAKGLEATDASRAAGLYATAFGLAPKDSLTRLALDGLARTASPADVEMLEAILPLVVEENGPPEASRAAARLAMNLPADRREEAVQVLEAVARILGQDPMVPGIVEHLWKIGSDFDPAREAGYVTSWLVAGPFKLRGGQTPWDESLWPDARPDVRAEARIEGTSYAWRPVRTPDAHGIVSLARLLGQGDGVAAYGYAEIVVGGGGKAALRVGSDDGIVVWLNGQRVHAVLEDRGLTVDQDRVDVELQDGLNRLLVKSLNTFGNWEYSVRVMSEDGKPMIFRQGPR